MRTFALLVLAIAVASCGSSKKEQALAATRAPTGDEALEFLEAWLAQVDEPFGAARLAPSAVVDIAGCADGASCLPRLKPLAGVILATSAAEAKLQHVGDRTHVTLRADDVLVGTLVLELAAQGDQIMVHSIRASWKESTAPAPEAATAFVEQWLRSMQDKAPPDDAGLDPSNVGIEPGCIGRRACISEYLHEIMSVRPTLTTQVVSRDDLDDSNDTHRLVRVRPDATFVIVEASGNIRKANIAWARLTAAVVKVPDGKLRIDALDVVVSYIPGTQD
jgi:hypothetical protein